MIGSAQKGLSMHKAVLLVGFLLIAGIGAMVSAETAPMRARPMTELYLPALNKPELIFEPMLLNPSFEDGWTDLPPAPGNLINQQPTAWQIAFVPIGDPLFNFTEISNGIPESIHKQSSQLPQHEQPLCDGTNAPFCCDPALLTCTPLILDGEWVYKSFHFGASFGTTLSQALVVPLGQPLSISVPIQIHSHGTINTFDAGVRLTVGDQTTDWLWLDQLADRTWVDVTLNFTATTQTPTVTVDFVNRYNIARDFFIDDLRLQEQP